MTLMEKENSCCYLGQKEQTQKVLIKVIRLLLFLFLPMVYRKQNK